MNVSISGPLFDYSGIAETSRRFIDALWNHGHECKAFHTWRSFYDKPGFRQEARRSFAIRHGKAHFSETVDLISNSRCSKNLERSLSLQTVNHAFLLHLAPPNHWDVALGEKFLNNIGYFVWEHPTVPEETLNHLKKMNEIWVPSAFVGQALDSLPIPVYKMNIGYFLTEPWLAPPKSEKSDTFTFLSHSAPVARKGFEILISAFVQEFDLSEPVCLRIQTPCPVSEEKLRLWKYLGGRHFERKKITVHSDYVSEKRLVKIYDQSHAFVLATGGEGFSLVLAQALARGLPTIAPIKTGNSEFMDPAVDFDVDIDTRLKISGEDHSLYEGLCFPAPNMEHLRAQMRYVYERQEESKKRAEISQQRVRREFTAKNALTILEKVIASRHWENLSASPCRTDFVNYFFRQWRRR